jgi:hypothetical protein
MGNSQYRKAFCITKAMSYVLSVKYLTRAVDCKKVTIKTTAYICEYVTRKYADPVSRNEPIVCMDSVCYHSIIEQL